MGRVRSVTEALRPFRDETSIDRAVSLQGLDEPDVTRADTGV
jgi:hypothetical protein